MSPGMFDDREKQLTTLNDALDEILQRLCYHLEEYTSRDLKRLSAEMDKLECQARALKMSPAVIGEFSTIKRLIVFTAVIREEKEKEKNESA